jgi:hypothetical protein
MSEIPIGGVIVTSLILYLTVAISLSFDIITDSRRNYGDTDYMIILLASFGWLPAIIIQLYIKGIRSVKKVKYYNNE